MSKNSKPKKVDTKETKPTKSGEIPTFKSPAKTTWGRIVILAIVAAMVLIPVVALIVMLLQ